MMGTVARIFRLNAEATSRKIFRLKAEATGSGLVPVASASYEAEGRTAMAEGRTAMAEGRTAMAEGRTANGGRSHS
jgi:hypothetical protein